MPHLLHELVQLIEIKLLNASMTHQQTIGVVKRTHLALTKILNFRNNKTFTHLHRYLKLATFINNTSYHTSIGCEPTVTFHGRLYEFFGFSLLEQLLKNQPSSVNLRDHSVMNNSKSSRLPNEAWPSFSTDTGGTATKKVRRILSQNKYSAFC